MKRFKSYLNEVEKPVSQVDKKAFETEGKKVKDYPVKNAGVFDNKTSKDETKKASYKKGADVAAYEKANNSDVKIQSGRAYSLEQIRTHLLSAQSESVEHLDEISKERLKSYVKKADTDTDHKLTRTNKMYDLSHQVRKTNPEHGWKIFHQAKKLSDKTDNRMKWSNKAEKKLKESEHLDEISKQRLGAYIKKASSDLKKQSAGGAEWHADYQHAAPGSDREKSSKLIRDVKRKEADKRHKGLQMAGSKIAESVKDRFKSLKEAKTYSEVTDDWAQKLVDVVGDIVDLTDEVVSKNNVYISQYGLKAKVRTLEDLRDELNAMISINEPTSNSVG